MHASFLSGWTIAMEGMWIFIVLSVMLLGGSVYGQAACRPTAPRDDCGMFYMHTYIYIN